MILALSLPKIADQLVRATVHRIVVTPGTELKPGTALLEVRADLGGGGEQDCPPLQFFRIVATERAHLSRLLVAAGDELVPGATIGVATTTAGESAEGAPTRALRSMSVGIRVDPLADD
jgi:hypothetical protein